MFIVFLRRSRSYVAQSRALLVVRGPRARWERMLAECPHRPAPPQSAQDRAACGTACVAAGRLALFASALLDRSLLSLCPVVEKKGSACAQRLPHYVATVAALALVLALDPLRAPAAGGVAALAQGGLRRAPPMGQPRLRDSCRNTCSKEKQRSSR